MWIVGLSPAGLTSSELILIDLIPTVLGASAFGNDDGSTSISTKLSPVAKSYDQVFSCHTALTVRGTSPALSQLFTPVSLPESIPVGATLVSDGELVTSTSR